MNELNEIVESKISFSFCKEFFGAVLAQPYWRSLKAKVVTQLLDYKAELQSYLEPQLADQVLLDLVGNDFRIIWGLQAAYKPELLQEVCNITNVSSSFNN